MVNKTTSLEKGKGKKGNFKNGKPIAAPVKKPKVEPKPETQCFYCKGKWSLEVELPQVIGR